MNSVIMAQADPPNEAENESHRSPTQKERFPTECWTMLVVTGGEHLIPGNNQAEVEGLLAKAAEEHREVTSVWFKVAYENIPGPTC